MTQESTPLNQSEITHWLRERVAEATHLPANDIDCDTAIASYGLDSSALLEISCDLEDWLDKEISHTTLYEYKTVNALAEHVANMA